MLCRPCQKLLELFVEILRNVYVFEHALHFVDLVIAAHLLEFADHYTFIVMIIVVVDQTACEKNGIELKEHVCIVKKSIQLNLVKRSKFEM